MKASRVDQRACGSGLGPTLGAAGAWSLGGLSPSRPAVYTVGMNRVYSSFLFLGGTFLLSSAAGCMVGWFCSLSGIVVCVPVWLGRLAFSLCGRCSDSESEELDL